MNSRLCQHHGQSILLDSGWSVEAHVVNTSQQFRLPNMQGGKITHVTVQINERKPMDHLQHSQSEFLKGPHGVQGGGGVRLQDLHLVSVPHQRAADQFVEQGLLRQVHLCPTAFIFRHSCRWTAQVSGVNLDSWDLIIIKLPFASPLILGGPRTGQGFFEKSNCPEKAQLFNIKLAR